MTSKTFNLIFREVDYKTFLRIKNGQKIYETRAGMPEYLDLSSGDNLIISCGADTITKTILEAHHFKNIDELLQKISLDDIMQQGTTREQAIEKWNSFPGYPERIAKYGIIAWKLN